MGCDDDDVDFEGVCKGVEVDGLVDTCDEGVVNCCCCCCWKVEGVGVTGDAMDEESERSCWWPCSLVVGVERAA